MSKDTPQESQEYDPIPYSITAQEGMHVSFKPYVGPNGDGPIFTVWGLNPDAMAQNMNELVRAFDWVMAEQGYMSQAAHEQAREAENAERRKSMPGAWDETKQPAAASGGWGAAPSSVHPMNDPSIQDGACKVSTIEVFEFTSKSTGRSGLALKAKTAGTDKEATAMFGGPNKWVEDGIVPNNPHLVNLLHSPGVIYDANADGVPELVLNWKRNGQYINIKSIEFAPQ